MHFSTPVLVLLALLFAAPIAAQDATPVAQGPAAAEPATPQATAAPATATGSVPEAAATAPEGAVSKPAAATESEAAVSKPAAATESEAAVSKPAAATESEAPEGLEAATDAPVKAAPAAATRETAAQEAGGEPASQQDDDAVVAEEEVEVPARAVVDEARAEAPMQPEAPAAADPKAPITLGPVGYDEQGRPGRVHTVATGDTLWDLSDAYLGTPWVWPSVWRANEDIANPHLIFPGDKIWISAHEMRRISEDEAARLLANLPASAGGSELGDAGMDSAARPSTWRFASGEHSGLLSAERLAAAASIVGTVNERTWVAGMDDVYVGLGADQVSAGDQFTIFRDADRVVDPETGRVFAHYVDILGWLEVREVGEEASVALIRHSFAEIRSGDRILPRRDFPGEIPIREKPEAVHGQLTYFPSHRTQVGGQDLVFLNRGAAHGLQVGSPLEVYRTNERVEDVVRDTKVRPPDLVVAKLLVVSTEPESAVAVVTHASTELEHYETFRGSDSPMP